MKIIIFIIFGTGYADTFKWANDYQDITELDEFKRRKCRIVAFDAVNYSRNVKSQYEEKFLNRDCNKAFCGFVTEKQLKKSVEQSQSDHLKIVTGNWGCGAFKGEKAYKAIIQLIAASESNRDMIYVSFDDDGFGNRFIEFYNYLIFKDFTVGQIYKFLLNYQIYNNENPSKNFFDFVYETES